MPPAKRPAEIIRALPGIGYTEEWHFRRIARTALLVPPAVEGARLVDLGTHPSVLHVIAEVGGYAHAEGVDCRPEGPPWWTVDVPGWGGGTERSYRIHNRDLQRDRLPFEDSSVDLVTSLETLEHLLDPMHYLIEVNRILRPGGRFLFTTPNAVSWRSMIRAARRQHPFVYPVLIPRLDTNRHNIEYTPAQVRTLMDAAGFDGRVFTRAWWYDVGWLQKLRFTLAGFRPRDRGDIIVGLVTKVAVPRLRYPPELYLLSEEDRLRNDDTRLDFRDPGPDSIS